MPLLAQSTGLPGPAIWFLTGTFVSNIGNGMHTLATGALLFQQTGDVAAFGIVLVLEQATTFLMQVLAGPLVDRGAPRRVAVMAEFVRGGAVCAFCLPLVAAPAHAVAIILAMTVVIRCIHGFHRAATFALTPSLVDTSGLAKLNGWFSGCQQGGQLAGLAATGLVMSVGGAPTVFLLNGFSFLFSALTLTRITSHRGNEHQQRASSTTLTSWQQISAAWSEFAHVMWNDVRLACLTIVSVADNVAFILFNILLAPLVAYRLSADPNWLSLLASAFAFGAMTASALAGRLICRLGTPRPILIGIAGQSAFFAAMWVIENPVAMVLLAGLLGAFNTLSWTAAVTAVQIAAPAGVRGRLAMVRNGLTALITAPLIPLAAQISQAMSPAAALLLASWVCAGFLVLAGATAGLRGQSSDVRHT